LRLILSLDAERFVLAHDEQLLVVDLDLVALVEREDGRRPRL
jgi:hypothetical protein